MAFSADKSDQRVSQGALLCSDWPGVSAPVQREHYFGGSDVNLAADLRGLQLFLFAEYSAGTPDTDNFRSLPVSIASRPFVSPLVKRLLGKPNGAAAVLGHVDTAWTYSFTWPGAGPKFQTFAKCGWSDAFGEAHRARSQEFLATVRRASCNAGNGVLAGPGSPQPPNRSDRRQELRGRR